MPKLTAPATSKSIIIASQKQDKQYYSLVKKSNAIIRKAKYNLSLREQKVLCYLISEIKDTDTYDTEKVIDIKAFYNFMDIGCKDYDKVRNCLKSLRDKSWWLEDKITGDDTVLSFLNTVKTNKRSGKAYIKFHESIMPFLKELKSEYTTYKLWYVMTMKSQYSIRLYELLKSVAGKQLWYFKTNELKKLLNCESYKQFGHLKARIIDPSVLEINERTDINVSYELIKNGRAYEGIEFEIQYKSDTDKLKVDKLIRSELDKGDR